MHCAPAALLVPPMHLRVCVRCAPAALPVTCLTAQATTLLLGALWHDVCVHALRLQLRQQRILLPRQNNATLRCTLLTRTCVHGVPAAPPAAHSTAQAEKKVSGSIKKSQALPGMMFTCALCEPAAPHAAHLCSLPRRVHARFVPAAPLAEPHTTQATVPYPRCTSLCTCSSASGAPHYPAKSVVPRGAEFVRMATAAAAALTAAAAAINVPERHCQSCPGQSPGAQLSRRQLPGAQPSSIQVHNRPEQSPGAQLFAKQSP
eukprot:scaffold148702_cov22-Tisochrysis_lutea.AAC.1